MENNDSFESSQPPSSIGVVGRSLKGRQCFQNGRPGGAVKSASMFDGTSVSQRRLRYTYSNLIALTYQIISLVCLLIVSSLLLLPSSLTIAKVITAKDQGTSDGVHREAAPSCYKPFTLGVFKDPLRRYTTGALYRINHT